MYRFAVRRRQSSVGATPRGDCAPGGRIRRHWKTLRVFYSLTATTAGMIPQIPHSRLGPDFGGRSVAHAKRRYARFLPARSQACSQACSSRRSRRSRTDQARQDRKVSDGTGIRRRRWVGTARLAWARMELIGSALSSSDIPRIRSMRRRWAAEGFRVFRPTRAGSLGRRRTSMGRRGRRGWWQSCGPANGTLRTALR